MGMLANSVVIAISPLILLQIKELIDQGNSEEAESLWNAALYQALPTFISSFGFSLGLQIVNELTNLFSSRPGLNAIARNTLPLILAGKEMVTNPLGFFAKYVVSMKSSAFSYGLLNCVSPITKTNSTDLDAAERKDEVELQPLNNKEENARPADSYNNLEILIYFIRQVNLEGMRKSLNLISIHLAGICSIYENNIIALETAKENVPANKRALLDNSYSDHLELLKQDLISIKAYQINLGMKEIQNFQSVSYKETLETAFKANLVLDEEAETAKEYVKYLTTNEKNIEKAINYAKFLEISIADEKYTTETAHPKHNEACKGFTNVSTLVKDNSVIDLLMLMKKIRETIEKFKENLLKIEGTDTASLPEGVFDEIKHIKDFINFILTEINQNIDKKYDNYAQAVLATKNNVSSVSFKDNRRITFHGDSDCSYRTSSGDESTSSGISTADSMHDNEEQQIRRQLVH